MANKSVFCICNTRSQADQIVERLKMAGFASNDISVLFADKGTSRDFAYEKETKAPEGTVAGVGTGGVIGGALGWLAGIGAIAVPGIGPFVAAGALMSALSGIAVGGAVGGLTGALIGLGIPELVAKRYEGKLQRDNILISVHSEDSSEIDMAKDIFEKAGAEDIVSASESPIPNDEDDEDRNRGGRGGKRGEPQLVDTGYSNRRSP